MTIKIMKKTTISDEEIHRFMDFDGLLKQNVQATKKASLTRWVLVSVGLVFLLLATWQVWPSQTKQPVSDKKEMAKTQPSVSAAPTVIDKKDKKQGKVEPMVSPKTSSPTTATVPAKQRPSLAVSAAQYREAEPAEGFPALYEYLNREIAYPTSALKDSIEGVESVSFMIDENGKPDQIKVLHSLGRDFDEEAIRLIKSMPAWKPATLDEKPVASRVSLPLTFTIHKLKK